MPIEKLRPTASFDPDRLAQLRAILPEAFADGKINWDTLREALGETLEDDAQEHFGLFWPGKREARRLASLPSKGTLIPQPGQGVDEDATHNLFIEGDNLEVLKLLQKSYAGRVKLIYIDPPYNTGNDFVYPDDYSEPLDAYLKRTGAVDDEGRIVTTNNRAGGRFHSTWLNMMYPRLLFAWKLLRDDGAIFISIDDNEFSNLKALMDEVFGEENFINIVSIKAKPSAGASGGGEDKRLKKNVEFLLIYAKDKNNENMSLRFRDVFDKENLFEHISDMREEGKSWKYTSVFTSLGKKELITTIKDGSGSDIRIFRHIEYQRSSINALLQAEANKSLLVDKESIEKNLYKKYLDKIFSDTNAQSSIRTRVMETLENEDGLFSIEYIPKSGRYKGKNTSVYYVGQQKRQVIWLSDVASIENDEVILKGKLSTLWDNLNWNNVAKEGGISFPNGKKPITFLQRIIELATTGEDEEIVMDFFAGSGSTAHAVMDLNAQDNGNRRFILVQLPEKARDVPDFDTIAELCQQRIRNVIAELGSKEIDLGFKSLILTNSNFSEWQPYTERDTPQLELRFTQAESPLVAGWTPENLLAEILLLQGFPLDSRARPLAEFKSNRVLEITSEFCQHRLYVCLDPKIQPETVQAFKLRPEDILVTLDSALSDEAKIRLADQVNLKVI